MSAQDAVLPRDNAGVSEVETPQQRAERVALERTTERSPLRGRPLPSRPRLGPTTLERYAAALGGPLAYMARLRAIELQTAEHLERLGEAWAVLAARSGSDAARFETAWRATAASWDFGQVNRLIDTHNRFYPAESRLPMDPRTGDFALIHGEPYTRELLSVSWILARFPPSLERAQAAA